MPRHVRLPLVLIFTAFALAACGKRGQLDAPPTEAEIAAQEKAKAEGQPLKQNRPKRTPITAPKRELFLDGLLD